MEPNELLARHDDGLIRRSFGLTVLSLNEEERSGRFIFSTDAIDSFDEVVEQSWDLKRYQKNPVVLYNHNRGSIFGSAQDSLPIGYAKDVGLVNGALEGTVCFLSKDANPMAEMCWRCFREGALRAGSVGFMPGDVREEKRGGKEIFVLANNELFEFSLTPIPANADAVAMSADGRDRTILKSLARKTPNSTPPSGGEGSAMDPKLLEAELDRLKSVNAALETKASEVEKTHLAAVESLTAKVATLETENKSLTDKNNELSGQLIASEVTPLVGKKIAPAQLTKFIKLRLEWGKDEFDAFVKDMADLPYNKTVTEDTGATNTNTATGRTRGHSAVLAAALKAANEAAGEELEN
jgi:HK97 family phage prohead protease